jgi:hypothetical protein
MITQQEIAKLYKQLLPKATETEKKVTLEINGITINFDKVVSKSQSTKGGNIIYKV